MVTKLRKREVNTMVVKKSSVKTEQQRVKKTTTSSVKKWPDCASEKAFWVNDGKVLRNLKELPPALRNMSDQTFWHHVNSNKHDFANWVDQVFGEKQLAEEVRKIKHKVGLAQKLEHFFQNPSKVSMGAFPGKDFQEKVYQKKIPSGRFILAGDVGGTKTNFGIFAKRKKPELLLSFHFKSKEINDFPSVVKQVLNHLKSKYNMTPSFFCFAGAGVVSKNGTYLSLTNLPWDIDAMKIKQKTGLRSSRLINDFQAIAYGLDSLPDKSILVAKKGKAVPNGTRIVVGAGTGLGKGILLYDPVKKRYLALPSEGGHGELPVANECEFMLSEFIRRKTGSSVVEWEDVLSGKGLQNMYQFLYQEEKQKRSKYSSVIKSAKFDPMLITKYKEKDPLAKAAFDLFLTFYARCARNFALDVLAQGGVYIAGGIAANNSPLFKKKLFADEFLRSKKQKKILENIPVYVIKDYDVSLYGAAMAALKRR